MPKGSILLVDDNPGITALMLRSRGYLVNVALDGLEGIKKAKNEHPDLILLDIMMPGIDGYEVCMKLKTDEDTKHIPVIMLTAKEDPEAISKSHARGADDYIVKPFSLPIVLSKLQDFLP